MLAFALFQSDWLIAAQMFLWFVTLAAFFVAGLYYSVRGTVFLVRKVRAILRGEPFSLPVGLRIKGRDGRWHDVFGAVVIALALAGWFTATLHADLVMSCEWIPWWTVEWWLYCYGR